MNIDSDAWRQTVIDGALGLGVRLSVDQATRMGRHAQEMLAWNAVTNLTAITDPLEVAIKHCVDSVAGAPLIDNRARVLDAGSGGGFPGIPLKIARPDLSVTLVDSVRKKVSFLKHVIRVLGLGGITAVQGRLEALGVLPQYQKQFDVVVCRAFSSLADFVALTSAFLAASGRLMALKGGEADRHHPMVKLADKGLVEFGGTRYEMKTHSYQLPMLEAERRLVVLKLLSEYC